MKIIAGPISSLLLLYTEDFLCKNPREFFMDPVKIKSASIRKKESMIWEESLSLWLSCCALIVNFCEQFFYLFCWTTEQKPSYRSSCTVLYVEVWISDVIQFSKNSVLLLECYFRPKVAVCLVNNSRSQSWRGKKFSTTDEHVLKVFQFAKSCREGKAVT